ncbi:MAG: hypothetical protein M0C28_44305 [Candidatus Moduliflexus flocculans]|nr:hypothetical protein [Candidatus Moduliflexus flocculans]
MSGQISDQWGESLGTPYRLEVQTPPLAPNLYVIPFVTSTIFVRPDEPVLSARAVNIQSADVTVAPLSMQDYFTLQGSFDLQQAYAPTDPSTYSSTFDLPRECAGRSDARPRRTEQPTPARACIT